MDGISSAFIWQCIVSASVTGVIGYLIGTAKDKKKELDKIHKSKAQELDTLISTCKELTEWKSGIESNLAELHVAIGELSEKIKNINNGELAIIRDRIIQSCRFFIEKGSITIIARANIVSMHDSYKAQGGNGICDSYYEKMIQLPISESISED